MKPPVNCPDMDTGDVAFVKATGAVGGHDVMEEYLACALYPFSASFSLRDGVDGVTPILKLKVSLPMFRAVHYDEEDNVKFLARVELEVENIVGSYSRPEHDACTKCLLNGAS
jgi:hypothetical protein